VRCIKDLEQILSAESHCPRSLIHLRAPLAPPLAPPGKTSDTDHRQDPGVPLALVAAIITCLSALGGPARRKPGHLQNVETKAPRTERGSHRRESGFPPAIGAQSAASRSSRIGDKAVRHVNAADGELPTILLKVPCEVSVVEDRDRRVAVRRQSPCRRLDHAAVQASAGGS
jgi:hypothetical protein